MWWEYKDCLVNLGNVSRMYLDGPTSIMIRFNNQEFRKFEFETEAEACEIWQHLRSLVIAPEITLNNPFNDDINWLWNLVNEGDHNGND